MQHCCASEPDPGACLCYGREHMHAAGRIASVLQGILYNVLADNVVVAGSV